LSDPLTIDAEPQVWQPNPLLAHREKVPHFLRTQWDETSARSFGPWRVAAPVDPAVGQTASAFPMSAGADNAPAPTQAHGADASADQILPSDAEPQSAENTSAWSEAAIAALQQEAREQGIQEGLALAREQHEAERQKDSELIRHLGIELRSLQQDPQRFFEPLKRLALHIAEQWVRGELHISGQVIEQLIHQCLEQLDPSGEKVHVELHPADLQRLVDMGEQTTENMILHADPQLRQGSVRVRLNETVVQDLIEHRVEAMARKLLQKPEAWLQQSHLLHPDKVSPVEDAQPMRNWSRQPLPVQDAEVKDAAVSAPPASEEPGATHNRPDEYGDFS